MTPLKKIIPLMAFTLILGNQMAWAENPITKLGRGVENIITSPVEFATQYARLAKEKKSYAAVAIVGTIYGVFWTVARTLGGVVETVTFLIPAPEHYAPLMDPPTPNAAHRLLANSN